MIVLNYDYTPNLILDVETDKAVFAIPRRSIERVKLDKKAEYQSGCVVHIVTATGNLNFDFQTQEEARAFFDDVRDII